MPFDIVWLHSMRINGDEASDRSLSFKNLTGRAGRLSSEQQFDFGYASAIAWLLVAIIAVVSVVQFAIMKEKK